MDCLRKTNLVGHVTCKKKTNLFFGTIFWNAYYGTSRLELTIVKISLQLGSCILKKRGRLASCHICTWWHRLTSVHEICWHLNISFNIYTWHPLDIFKWHLLTSVHDSCWHLYMTSVDIWTCLPHLYMTSATSVHDICWHLNMTSTTSVHDICWHLYMTSTTSVHDICWHLYMTSATSVHDVCWHLYMTSTTSVQHDICWHLNMMSVWDDVLAFCPSYVCPFRFRLLLIICSSVNRVHCRYILSRFRFVLQICYMFVCIHVNGLVIQVKSWTYLVSLVNIRGGLLLSY